MDAADAAFARCQVVSSAIEDIRRRPQPHSAAGIEGLATVLAGDERKLVQCIEQVRVIAATRTPSSLRGFTVWASTLFPVLFAPYFAALGLETEGVPWAAYLTSILFSFTTSALVSIQNVLEDPFDGDTTDDIELAMFAWPVCDTCDPPLPPDQTVLSTVLAVDK